MPKKTYNNNKQILFWRILIMKLFLQKSKTLDERIAHTKNKIYKEAYGLTMLLCIVFAVINYQIYRYNMILFSMIIIIVIPSLYIYIKSIIIGLYSDEVEVHDRNSKTQISLKKMISGIIIGLFMGLFFGIRSSLLYAHNTKQHIVFFIIVFLISTAIYIPFFLAFIMLPHFTGQFLSKKISLKNENNDLE